MSSTSAALTRTQAVAPESTDSKSKGTAPPLQGVGYRTVAVTCFSSESRLFHGRELLQPTASGVFPSATSRASGAMPGDVRTAGIRRRLAAVPLAPGPDRTDHSAHDHPR